MTLQPRSEQMRGAAARGPVRFSQSALRAGPPGAHPSHGSKRPPSSWQGVGDRQPRSHRHVSQYLEGTVSPGGVRSEGSGSILSGEEMGKLSRMIGLPQSLYILWDIIFYPELLRHPNSLPPFIC